MLRDFNTEQMAIIKLGIKGRTKTYVRIKLRFDIYPRSFHTPISDEPINCRICGLVEAWRKSPKSEGHDASRRKDLIRSTNSANLPFTFSSRSSISKSSKRPSRVVTRVAISLSAYSAPTDFVNACSIL